MESLNGFKFMEVWKLKKMLEEIPDDHYVTTQNANNTGGITVFKSAVKLAPTTYHIDIAEEKLDDYVHEVVRKFEFVPSDEKGGAVFISHRKTSGE